MTELTQEQRQTIEDALNSIPESVRTGMYGTMEGIEEQLARGDKIIFYMKPNELGWCGFNIDKMKVGEE
jgi:predicted Zn-ribbon and HTH transcriptional regulator